MRIAGLAVAAVLLAVVAAQAESAEARPSFDPDAYMAHVRFLANDELGGRGTGSAGNDRAAEYIAEQLRLVGCQPGGDDGTFFQYFPTYETNQLDREAASFEIEGVEREWPVGTDWTPLPFTQPGPIEGPVAFAGYGIQTRDFGYNDYDDFDADGKVLLILRYEPQARDRRAEFGGEKPSTHAYFATKARRAARNGAAALLIVDPPSCPDDDGELYPFSATLAAKPYDLPMVQVSREVAETLLKRGGQPPLAELEQRITRTLKPASADLPGVSVRIDQAVRTGPVMARNVIGIMPGDGSTEEAIVVGGHYDHLGQLVTRDSQGSLVVHNGADDNASGTAGVLEIARVMSGGPPLHRKVVFIAFGAEEIGLLGSNYYASHPKVPLHYTRAMLNLDMIGHLYGRRLALSYEPNNKDMRELLRDASSASGIHYRRSLMFAGGSDHVSFAHSGCDIATVFACSGLHMQYHQPSDDWELIDVDGAIGIMKMMHALAVELATVEEVPRPEDE
ncbi:MAG: M28 family peptidase [Phycisphaerae bacterium]|nr:M28 family peptidase [Phycisphaerae bacterium]